jgi:hypothetical protein
MLPHNHTWRLKFYPVILTRIKKLADDGDLMIETWVILSVLVCDIRINVLL